MIDEKKLIEELRKKAKEYDEDCGYWNKRGECANGLICAGKCTGIVRAIKMIEQQPKVGEWIPCSEKLPELHRQDLDSEGEYIMISNSVIVTDGEDISVSQYEIDDADDKGWLNNGRLEDVDVIAWMPLPEPYRP